MGMLTDLAGLGAFGKRAQSFASKRSGSQSSDIPPAQGSADTEDLSSPVPGSGMDDANNSNARKKRSNGKGRN